MLGAKYVHFLKFNAAKSRIVFSIWYLVFCREIQNGEIGVIFFCGLVVGLSGVGFVFEVSEEFSFSVDFYLGEEFVFLVAESYAAIL